jgi:hypothetical protein
VCGEGGELFFHMARPAGGAEDASFSAGDQLLEAMAALAANVLENGHSYRLPYCLDRLRYDKPSRRATGERVVRKLVL